MGLGLTKSAGIRIFNPAGELAAEEEQSSGEEHSVRGGRGGGSEEELELERASRGERAASVKAEEGRGRGGVAVGLNGQRGKRVS